MTKHLIVIAGPTAIGKTSLAIQLARHFKTDILSADSRQFYREMSIGTAKPRSKELEKTRHHFVNSRSIEEPYNVGQFEQEALERLLNLFLNTNIVVMTGGSGLFIKAVCDGLDEFPEVPERVRQHFISLFEKEGIEALQIQLRKADPEYAEMVDLQNPHRLIRALSVCKASEKPFSSFLRREKKSRFFKPIYILLEMDREQLYQRINNRVDHMMASGLLEEAKGLYPKKHLTALQTVGYQELFDYFDHKYSLEEAVDLIKRNSRRYAKRQLTWFRNEGRWKSFQPLAIDDIIQYAQNQINGST